MIKEAYVSFDVAKLLKEKGFNDEVRAYYLLDNETKEDELIHDDRLDTPNQWSGDYYSAPTHQVAMAWLREVHGIFIAINNDDLDFNWQCYDLINRESTLDPKILSESYAGYKTYEKAVEVALKYCLENLI